MRRAAIVLTLALGGLFAVYGALVLLDLLARHEVRSTQALVVPAGGDLALEAGSSDVLVQAGDGPPQLVAVAKRGLFGGSDVRVERDGDGRLSVRADCGFLGGLLSCEESLQVRVPGRTAVRIDTGSGDLDVRGMLGGLEADTGSGDLTLDTVGGAVVDADTGSGNLTGSGLLTSRLRARTGSGDADVSMATAPQDVDIDTGSGDLDLTLPDEVYDVGAETGSGDQRVTVRADSASSRRLRLRTGSGDLSVQPAR